MKCVCPACKSKRDCLMYNGGDCDYEKILFGGK